MIPLSPDVAYSCIFHANSGAELLSGEFLPPGQGDAGYGGFPGKGTGEGMGRAEGI